INDDGRIKISDFGIAHLDSSSLTQIGEIMGSPGYMSPEQFTGDEPDARSDIYSAGVIAYELLAGRKPFIGSNVEIMRQVISERPGNPSQYNPQISVQLDWATHKALAKKREDRFQSARDFALAFTQGISASLRTSKATASEDTAEAPTQRLDSKLVSAARMLAGLQAVKPAATSVPSGSAKAGTPTDTTNAPAAAEVVSQPDVTAAKDTTAAADADAAAERSAVRAADVEAPATTGSISKGHEPPAAPAAGAESSASASSAEAKSWGARATEIWQMWFGK
ncbi:MAG: serine/threonine-protein kinase, partial [Hyphomicrobium sp.]